MRMSDEQRRVSVLVCLVTRMWDDGKRYFLRELVSGYIGYTWFSFALVKALPHPAPSTNMWGGGGGFAIFFVLCLLLSHNQTRWTIGPFLCFLSIKLSNKICVIQLGCKCCFPLIWKTYIFCPEKLICTNSFLSKLLLLFLRHVQPIDLMGRRLLQDDLNSGNTKSNVITKCK